MESKVVLSLLRIALPSFVILGSLAACGSPQSARLSGADYASSVAAAPMEIQSKAVAGEDSRDKGESMAKVPRMVSRRVDLQLRVKKLDTAEKEIRDLTARLRGYVESATSSDLATDRPQMSMSLRIPVKEVDRAIESLESLGTRLGKSISSEDVTAQVVDFDARMKTRRAQEESLRLTLAQARKLADIIVLQDKLMEVREQIESMTGQRNALADQAAMSTVTVSLTQHIEPLKGDKDPDWIRQTFGESLASLAGIARSILSLMIQLVVFTPVWLPFVWIIWRFVKGQKPVA